MGERQHYDTVVIGAGTAGAIAAIAAARTGAKTLIIEQYGSIGGILSTGMTLLGASDAEGYKALGGIAEELFDRLIHLGGGTETSIDPRYGSVTGHDPELAVLTLMEMAQEAGVDFLLHTFMAEVLMDGRKITGIKVAHKGGLEVITGECFVDCTGDADLVARADGEFTFGRESDGMTQPVSALFRVGNVDLEKVWVYLENNPEELEVPDTFTGSAQTIEYLRNTPGAHFHAFGKLTTKARQAGEYDIPRSGAGISTMPGRNEVTVNMTRIHGIDGTNPDDITKAEIESQKQILQGMRFLKKYVPGFEHAHIISRPYQIGVRETRHIKGKYILNRDDILNGRDFDDQIGRGAYPLDVHDIKSNTEVMGRVVQGDSVTLMRIQRSYGIPMRCLIPKSVDNVVVGGRSISATHEAAGSIRGQAVCMVTGHAAGTIAAMAATQQKLPKELNVTEVQDKLRSQNAIIERE